MEAMQPSSGSVSLMAIKRIVLNITSGEKMHTMLMCIKVYVLIF